MDAPYRAVFTDLRTDQAIDVLPLRDVEYDDYIGKPGSLSGTLVVPNGRVAARVRQVVEGRTAVYLERGSEPCWGGIVWTLTPATDDRGITTVALQAATFDSYAGRRYIRADLTFTATDQLEVVRRLWDHMQAAEGGAIGVEYDPLTSGALRSVTYRDGDETLVEEAIGQLAGMEPGFETWIAVYRDPATGRRVKRLRLGSPRIQVGSEPLLLDLPGDVISYAFPRDATRGGTTARARGGTPPGGDRPVISDEQVAGDLIAAGYPRLDTTSDHSTVTDKAALNALARADLAALRGPVVIPSVRIRRRSGDTASPLGRTVRLRIRDVWFHEGLDAHYRVVGIKVTGAERGRAETAELYLEEAR
ncbi:hypothetical protein AQ490_18465 [Wenjunlia vitaminophila]|uniref:Phage protein D n=1 Tax=Wenjunlia vitaminophila TaxID=76728 RepID=A0A0T6LVG5_WENVI|nr:hypothetical protein [Wenjunlia vitaminophila]KRV49695.1 hypothetical protein AQ490_18465 [Wenjunlia vitaminophila]